MNHTLTLRFLLMFALSALAACEPGSSGKSKDRGKDTRSGEEQVFESRKSCPAYQSKNNKTNPGDAKTEAGKQYAFVRFNREEGPDWVQVRVPDASPAERWVQLSCGKMAGGSTGGKNEEVADEDDGGEEDEAEDNSKDQCRTAGRADDHTFALSWQPAFCELKSGKKECKVRDTGVYQAKNFTLHGLWPNKDACHTNYGFCKGEKKFKDFCQYDPIPLSPQMKKELSRVMPSVSAGTCLERYEWFKHGLCQTNWDAEEYYAIAVKLTNEFNRAAGPIMARNIGGSVKEKDFYREIDAVFGADAHKRLQMKCQKSGDLVDVYIKLPRQINKDASLRDLMQQARPDFRSNCGGEFQVDEIDD